MGAALNNPRSMPLTGTCPHFLACAAKTTRPNRTGLPTRPAMAVSFRFEMPTQRPVETGFVEWICVAYFSAVFHLARQTQICYKTTRSRCNCQQFTAERPGRAPRRELRLSDLSLMRCGETASRLAHNQEIAGVAPAAASSSDPEAARHAVEREAVKRDDGRHQQAAPQCEVPSSGSPDSFARMGIGAFGK